MWSSWTELVADERDEHQESSVCCVSDPREEATRVLVRQEIIRDYVSVEPNTILGNGVGLVEHWSNSH